MTPWERLVEAAKSAELVDAADIADLLGISITAVNYHAKRPGFPRPIRRHATHRWWLLEDIAEWDANDNSPKRRRAA